MVHAVLALVVPNTRNSHFHSNIFQIIQKVFNTINRSIHEIKKKHWQKLQNFISFLKNFDILASILAKSFVFFLECPSFFRINKLQKKSLLDSKTIFVWWTKPNHSCSVVEKTNTTYSSLQIKQSVITDTEIKFNTGTTYNYRFTMILKYKPTPHGINLV